MSRRVATIASVLAALLGFGVARMYVAGSSPFGAAAAAQGESYVLSDFQIVYPYRPAEPGGQPAPGESGDPARAGIGFTAAWTSSSFPGDAWCHMTITDSHGAVVGEEDFLASYAVPRSIAPYLRVSVSGVPARVEASCGAGQYALGRGYSFDNRKIAQAPMKGSWTAVSFTASRLSQYASVRSCKLDVLLTNGEHLTQSFEFEGPDGSGLELYAPAAVNAVETATVTCGPI